MREDTLEKWATFLKVLPIRRAGAKPLLSPCRDAGIDSLFFFCGCRDKLRELQGDEDKTLSVINV